MFFPSWPNFGIKNMAKKDKCFSGTSFYWKTYQKGKKKSKDVFFSPTDASFNDFSKPFSTSLMNPNVLKSPKG